ncbi:hypothetical protein FNV43_RR10851 [Rhamnella rubrinervis]|uniref:Uncharacterized protein n=1 Tax=Rhamnella rubrinervis TaxID=2594499 RepID=A0A8K0H4P6_9ROSA|nr:hypothetical protein FNV43_RR10851 [Rhamnella rubrinervis]
MTKFLTVADRGGRLVRIIWPEENGQIFERLSSRANRPGIRAADRLVNVFGFSYSWWEAKPINIPLSLIAKHDTKPMHSKVQSKLNTHRLEKCFRYTGAPSLHTHLVLRVTDD